LYGGEDVISNFNCRFLGSIVPEEKAFDALKPHHKAKLTEIFKDIDFDDVKAIDMHKAVRYTLPLTSALINTSKKTSLRPPPRKTPKTSSNAPPSATKRL
jgi:hypothetical protein